MAEISYTPIAERIDLSAEDKKKAEEQILKQTEAQAMHDAMREAE